MNLVKIFIFLAVCFRRPVVPRAPKHLERCQSSTKRARLTYTNEKGEKDRTFFCRRPSDELLPVTIRRTKGHRLRHSRDGSRKRDWSGRLRYWIFSGDQKYHFWKCLKIKHPLQWCASTTNLAPYLFPPKIEERIGSACARRRRRRRQGKAMQRNYGETPPS